MTRPHGAAKLCRELCQQQYATPARAATPANERPGDGMTPSEHDMLPRNREDWGLREMHEQGTGAHAHARAHCEQSY
jgi:hypothetical protein